MIRLGIIGLGFGAAVQLPAFRALPGVEVTAVGGRRPDKARELAQRFGIPLGGSADDVLAAPLDALAVALPPALGADISLRALDKGWAVLAEKPLADSAARAALLAARAAGRTAAVDFELAELECFRQLRERCAGQAARSVAIQWRTRSYAHEHRLWNWKTDAERHGGVLNLLGSHVFFLVEWLFGPIDALEARLSDARTRAFAPPAARAAEDQAQLRARTRAGTEISVALDNAAALTEHRWTIDLPAARFVLEEGARSSLTLAQEGASGRTVLAADIPEPGRDWRIAPFQRLAARFVDCAARRAPCFPGFDAGARVQLLLEAARRSAANGGAPVDTRGQGAGGMGAA